MTNMDMSEVDRLNRRRDPSSLLPLQPSAFHILLVLARGDSHGYAIAQEVEAATGGAVRLGTGTLYRQLKQMAADGWIVDTQAAAGDPLGRRFYRLSGWGRRIAEVEAERLDALVRLARSHRLLPATS
jgi:DNA-binding PadR family transcriptional regulator